MHGWSWIHDVLFRRDPSELRGAPGVAVRAGRLVYLTVGQFRRDHGFERAASLTFASIISLIPLVVLFFGFAESLGGGGKVVDFVLDKVIPQVAPENEEYVREWLDGISRDIFHAGPAGFVNLAAVVGLLLVALGIFVTAERVFNRIWKVPGRRSWLQKVTAFWVILTTSPFMIIASIWIGDLLVPDGGRIQVLTESYWIFDALYRFLVPATIGFLAFTLVFVFLPATRVRVTSAALGGLTTAILWQVASRWGYGLYLERVGEVTSYYKELAKVPLFLIWIYITWIVILLGGEVSYVHQNLALLSRLRRRDEGATRFSRAVLGLYLLARIVRAFSTAEPLPSVDAVAGEIGARGEAVDDVARALVANDTLIADAAGGGIYTLACDPSRVPLGAIVALLRDADCPADARVLGPAEPGGGPGGVAEPEGPDAGTGPIRELLRAARTAEFGAYRDRSLASLAGLPPAAHRPVL